MKFLCAKFKFWKSFEDTACSPRGLYVFSAMICHSFSSFWSVGGLSFLTCFPLGDSIQVSQDDICGDSFNFLGCLVGSNRFSFLTMFERTFHKLIPYIVKFESILLILISNWLPQVCHHILSHFKYYMALEFFCTGWFYLPFLLFFLLHFKLTHKIYFILCMVT